MGKNCMVLVLVLPAALSKDSFAARSADSSGISVALAHSAAPDLRLTLVAALQVALAGPAFAQTGVDAAAADPEAPIANTAALTKLLGVVTVKGGQPTLLPKQIQTTTGGLPRAQISEQSRQTICGCAVSTWRPMPIRAIPKISIATSRPAAWANSNSAVSPCPNPVQPLRNFYPACVCITHQGAARFAPSDNLPETNHAIFLFICSRNAVCICTLCIRAYICALKSKRPWRAVR